MDSLNFILKNAELTLVAAVQLIWTWPTWN